MSHAHAAELASQLVEVSLVWKELDPHLSIALCVELFHGGGSGQTAGGIRLPASAGSAEPARRGV